MVEIREIIRLDFERELNDLIELENNDLLTKEKENDSFDFMITQLDEHYRHKDWNDWGFDIWDLQSVLNILQDDKKSLIECYGLVIEYLS